MQAWLQWGRGSSAAEIGRILPQRNCFPIAASMGPRLFSRGNQVGRGTDRAIERRASMGPRLFSRGNARRPPWPHCGLYGASMGPRLFSRGNEVAGGAHGWHAASFNGAAALQPRKCSQLVGDPTAPAVASMGPRLFSRGNCRAMAQAYLAARPASMGPRLFSRGNAGGCSGSSPSSGSFNGAAALQPRKWRASTAMRPSATSLQWGRGSSAAEMLGRIANAHAA